MNSRIWTIVAGLGLALALGANSVSAHEGRIVLKNTTAACEGISTWRDGRYRLVGRCAGLVYPYQERIDKYVLWVRDGAEAPRRIGSINLGLFDGMTESAFTQVFISVEANSSPRQPGELIIATANLQPLDFGTVENKPIEPEPLAPRVLSTPTPTPASALVVSSGVTRRAGIAIAAAIGIFVVILIGIFISRRGS